MLTSPSIPDRFDDLATPLCDVTFVVLDLETTGTSPDLDEITEVGAVKYRGGECLGTFDTLVNPGMPIPPFISVLTGITEAMVLPAPRIDEVLPALLEFIGGGVIVGHNIRFDISFLDAALVRRGGARLQNPRADTLGMSRRLLHDEVDDLKLGTLARHLRVSVEPCHRAFADADATAEVFHALLERAGTFGVLALDDLIALPKIRQHPSTSKLRLTARAPRRPGVYQFRDRSGAVLYVGRARNLRAAVRAHFHGDRRQVPQLLCETEAISWTECTDELEASVREARLIREHEPRFNRQGKGWRGYAYLKLTLNERFPRLAVVHAARDDGALYVGPLASFAAVTALRSAIEAAVPLRRCSTRIGSRVDPNGATRCSAAAGLVECPCCGHGSEAEYQAVVDTVVRGLQGEADALLDTLTARMHDLAGADDFEAAARARDQRATLAGVLNHHQLLSWLRTSGTVRFLTDSGVIELEHGRLALGDDGDGDAPTDASRAAAVEREGLDELLVVARWIKREVAAGRARIVEPTDGARPAELTPPLR